MLTIIILALFIQLMVFRVKFRKSRVQYFSFEKNEFIPTELSELILLLKLTKKGNKTIQLIEWLYHHLLWRLVYIFLGLTFLLLFMAVGVEGWFRIDTVEHIIKLW